MRDGSVTLGDEGAGAREADVGGAKRMESTIPDGSPSRVGSSARFRFRFRFRTRLGRVWGDGRCLGAGPGSYVTFNVYFMYTLCTGGRGGPGGVEGVEGMKKEESGIRNQE